jgi:hypothetical protein
MPSTNKAKAVFDHGKTSSYHIKCIVNCQQSTKSTSIFKFVVQRDAGHKRYDYEAESPSHASTCIFLTLKGCANEARRGNRADNQKYEACFGQIFDAE